LIFFFLFLSSYFPRLFDFFAVEEKLGKRKAPIRVDRRCWGLDLLWGGFLLWAVSAWVAANGLPDASQALLLLPVTPGLVGLAQALGRFPKITQNC
jgi:hypothetical protein